MVRQVQFLAAFFIALLCSKIFGWEVTSMKVTGDEDALITFNSVASPEVNPAFTIKENLVEFVLPQATLHSSFQGKVKIPSPHALIKNLVITEEKKGVSVMMEINGPSEGLKQRLKFSKEANGILLTLGLPLKVTPAIELAKEEQKPILTDNVEKKSVAPSFGASQIALIVLVFALAGIATFFVVRFMRSRTASSGSKKYLIEPLATCSLSPKASLHLVRVGREFVLVGVSSSQVNHISSLPALQAQYEEESRFERESFRDAVDEEIARLKKEISL